MVTCTSHPLSLDWTEANAKEQGRGAVSESSLLERVRTAAAE